MAANLGADDEFLALFITTQDPQSDLKPRAEDSARACRPSTAEQAKNEFLERESLRQAFTLPDDETLIRLLRDAEGRTGTDPHDWSKQDLEEVRKALRELADGRYQSDPGRLRDVPTNDLRSRALDCLARGEPGQWRLPDSHEASVGRLLTNQHRRSLRRARQDRVPDPEDLASAIQESLMEKARRHSVREYLASGRFPGEDSLSAWLRAAADKEYPSRAGGQRPREAETGTSSPESPAFPELLQAEFDARRTLYKSDEVLRTVMDFVTSGRPGDVSEPAELLHTLRAACPHGIDPGLVTQLFLAALERMEPDDNAGLAVTSDSINYGGGS